MNDQEIKDKIKEALQDGYINFNSGEPNYIDDRYRCVEDSILSLIKTLLK